VTYAVYLTPGARDDIERLDAQVRKRVITKISRLAENFDDLDPEPLSAHWHGYYKLRVGDCKPNRETRTITFYRVAHRQEVYL